MNKVEGGSLENDSHINVRTPWAHVHGAHALTRMYLYSCSDNTYMYICTPYTHENMVGSNYTLLSNKDLEENGKPGGKYRTVYFVDQKSQLRR